MIDSFTNDKEKLMGLAPNPMFPEKFMPNYERTAGNNPGGTEGPRRFEEGIVSDSDVPRGFGTGAYGDVAPVTPMGAQAQRESQFKHADETMRERAHVGSASWVDANSVLGAFAKGAFAGHGLPQYEQVNMPGTRMERANIATVSD